VPLPARPASGKRSYAQERVAHAHEHDTYYRRRLRWVRARWFSCGIVLGMVTGVLFTLGASIFLAKQLPAIIQDLPGQPDLSVMIGESYLNREAGNQIGASYPTGVPGVSLTALRIDLLPGNRMELQPTFHVDAIFKFDVNARVANHLFVRDGRLVINTVGDPQLGELQVPLDMLPFDLNQTVRQTIDKINNEVLISEINDSLQSGFGGTNFRVNGVTTDESGMTIQLEER
jgi:hypothetical protein